MMALTSPDNLISSVQITLPTFPTDALFFLFFYLFTLGRNRGRCRGFLLRAAHSCDECNCYQTDREFVPTNTQYKSHMIASAANRQQAHVTGLRHSSSGNKHALP